MRDRISKILSAQPSFQFPAYRAFGIVAQLHALLFRGRKNEIETLEPMLVIVGSGRSGNTILRRLLMERGSIYIPPETYIWSSQVGVLLRAPALKWDEKIALLLGRLEFSPEFDTFQMESLRGFALAASAWPTNRQTLGDLIQGLYRWLAEEKGVPAQWVGEKTPMNLSRIGLIEKTFPEARYLYIERDGVDVAISYRDSGLYPDLVSGARRWRQSRDTWFRFSASISESRKFQVRFEDLVSNHIAVSEAALNHFKIPLRQEKVDVSKALGDVFTRPHHTNVRNPDIGPRPVGAARQKLSQSEREQLRTTFGNALVDAGYESI